MREQSIAKKKLITTLLAFLALKENKVVQKQIKTLTIQRSRSLVNQVV